MVGFNFRGFGAVIRAWRLFRGLRRKALAEKAGVRPEYLSEIENDKKRNPWLAQLEKLAAALEISLKDIHDRRLPPGQGKREDDQALGQGPQAIDVPRLDMADELEPLSPEKLTLNVYRLFAQLAEVEAQTYGLSWMRERLQELTAAVSQLQADVVDLKQAMGIEVPVATPDRQAIDNEELAKMDRKLAQLPPQDRQILILSSVYQYSAAEIGYIMRLSSADVLTRISEARARLQSDEFIPTLPSEDVPRI